MEESLTMQHWLTPKQYFRLLYQSLFQAISLTQEVENWPQSRRLAVTLQAGAYNYILALALALTVKLLFFPSFSFFGQDFGNVVIGVVLGVSLGMTIGVVGGAAVGVAAGLAYGAVFGVAAGATGGVAAGVVFGVSRRLTYRLAFGLIVGLVFGFFVGLVFGAAFGVAFTIAYFFILGRYFYWSFYYFRYSSTSPRNPLRWDENIALPIPFFTSLLRRYTEKEGWNPSAPPLGRA